MTARKMHLYPRYPFYPRGILSIGLTLIAFGVMVALFSDWLISQSALVIDPIRRISKESAQGELHFSLGEQENSISLPLPHLESEFSFFRSPSRPNQEEDSLYIVSLRGAEEQQEISLPCRLGLRYENSHLFFAPENSSFWIDLSMSRNHWITGVVQAEGSTETETFTASLQDITSQTASDWEEGACFRFLADAIWKGKNLFVEKTERVDRHFLLIQQQMIEVEQGEWLFWNGEYWDKGEAGEKAVRVVFVGTHQMILEGWDDKRPVRLMIPLQSSSAASLRPEEIITALRLRSERQISCMLDKQCFVMRCGDWALKKDGKWRILRREEEQESVRKGSLSGELFVFEEIETKQAQKWIRGTLFTKEKTESVAVHLPATSGPLRRGKP
ncbi:MAG: hypothetical protein KGI80_00650 [Verrucomicrobiota bacterium]|nr:hypothetical protein [Verrucomicrobiota bacterium]